MTSVRTRITNRGVVQEPGLPGESLFSIEVDSSFSGSLQVRQQYQVISGSFFNLSESQLGKMLEIDPNNGTTTINLSGSIAQGFYCMARQINTGTVNFAAVDNGSIVSTVGSAPSISSQWGHITLDKRNSTTWVIAGDIA